MKKLLLFILFPFSAFAQQGFSVGLHAGYNYTGIRNKDDKESEQLKQVAGYMPEARFQVGYGFGKEGIFSVITGIGYFSAVQKYDGYSKFSPGLKYFTAKTHLSYLKIPLLLSVVPMPGKKISPVLSAGVFYTSLLTYKDEKRGTASNYMEDYLVEGLHYSQNDFYIHSTAALDKPYYRKSVWGAQLRLGAQIKLAKHFVLQALAQSSYTFGDVENKTTINHKGGMGSYNPWDYMKPKYFNENLVTNYQFRSNRPASHVIAIGVEVGIYYCFKNNSPDF